MFFQIGDRPLMQNICHDTLSVTISLTGTWSFYSLKGLSAANKCLLEKHDQMRFDDNPGLLRLPHQSQWEKTTGIATCVHTTVFELLTCQTLSGNFGKACYMRIQRPESAIRHWEQSQNHNEIIVLAPWVPVFGGSKTS